MTIGDLRRLCAELLIIISIHDTVRPSDAARLLGISPRTLRRWRSDGSIPPPVRIGRSLRYRLADLVSAFDRPRDPDPLPALDRREHDQARPLSPCSITRRRSAA